MTTKNEEIPGNLEKPISPKRTKPPLPIDRGWAWMVMLGLLINQTIMLMFIRGTSIFFLEFLDRYKASATSTTLASGLTSMTSAVAVIFVSSYIVPRFKARNVAFVGATLSSLCVLGVAFAPNIIVINVFYAIFGASISLMYMPQMTLMGHYFKRHISIAMAASGMGLSIATCASPPLTRFLLDKYGLQGTLIITFGYSLNYFVGSALSRPLSFYSEESESDEVSADNDSPNSKHEQEVAENGISNGKIDKEINHLEFDALLEKSSNVCSIEIEVLDLLTPEKSLGKHVEGMGVTDQVRHHKKVNGVMQTDDDHTLKTNTLAALIGSSTSLGRPCSQRRRSSLGRRLSHSVPFHEPSFLSHLSNSSSMRYLSNSELLTIGATAYHHRSVRSLHSRKDEHGHSSTLDVGTGSKLTVNGETEVDNSESQLTFKQKLRRKVTNSVLCNPLALLLITAGGIGHHMQAVSTYMPALGKENGLDADQVSFLLTVLGLTDLVSRFSVGWIADRGWVRISLIVCSTQFLLALTLNLIHFYDTFPILMSVQIPVGMCLTSLQTLMPAMVVKLLGVENFPRVMSLYYATLCMNTFCDHLIVGLFKDVTNSFHGAFHYMAGSAILSGLLFSLEMPVSRYLERKKPKQQSQDTQ